MNAPEDLISLRRAGAILGRCAETVWRYVARGKLRGWRVAGGHWRVSEAEARALLIPRIPDLPPPAARVTSRQRERELAALRRAGVRV